MKTSTLRTFFIITFAWAWILWLPFVLPAIGLYEMTETLEGLLMLAVMLGAFGPLVSAVILSARHGEKGAVKAYFKKCLDFRVKPRYYVWAVVLGLAITAFTHYFVNIVGIDTLPNNLIPEDLDIPMYILVVPYTLMLFVLGGGQEEFGWRGFAQDPMQDRFGIIKGSLMIGLLWSLWHLPLWFIEGEGHSYYSFFAFALYATSWSVVIGIMYNLSGKRMVIPWIMHTMGNLSVPLFPVLFLEDVPQPGYWVWAGFNAIVAIGLSYWFYHKNQERVSA
jgi:membrane protease YdiL (CAAX protease family)